MMRAVLIMIAAVLLLSFGAAAAAPPRLPPGGFSDVMDQHGTIMMLVDPETGNVVFANQAAAEFYGYSKSDLEQMNMQEINTLDSEIFFREINAAANREKNFFIVKHQSADGEIHTVEVWSYPVVHLNKKLLFSVVHDITDKARLEKAGIIMASALIGALTLIVAVLTLLILTQIRSNKRQQARNREIEIKNELQRTYIDANNNLVYLKDENLRYVFVNKAVELFYGKSASEIIGQDDYALSENAFADKQRTNDEEALRQKKIIVDELEWKNRHYLTTKFPVGLQNGRYGVGAYVSDITEFVMQQKRQKKTLVRSSIVAEAFSHSFRDKQEQLDYVLHQALALTESQYGYIYYYDEKTKTFTLNSWTLGVMDDCTVTDKKSIYHLDRTGIWGEVVRQRKPIVINDFESGHPLAKGCPVGHVKLKRFLSVPVIIENEIVAVIGMANKEEEYDDSDAHEMTVLMSGVWHALERRESQQKLAYERSKYLQTLISIGDGVMVADCEGRIEVLNTVAEKLTGWNYEEANGRHYSEVFRLRHENSTLDIRDPIRAVLETGESQEPDSYAVLESKDGRQYDLEDSASPIRNGEGQIVGVVMVFRDVTEKKQQRLKIEYLSFHDSLTGLYNRGFFEEEMKRLDTARNLPLSIIMGDVNGLKLTNDVFGHEHGDQLLKTVSEVIKKVCRADDIIARWGGDEFVVLLPKTAADEAAQIMRRIKDQFSHEKIMALKGSISLGCDTKLTAAETLTGTVKNAETSMYSAKALERSEIRASTREAIIRTLHEESRREKEHAQRVSEMCSEMGRKLGLTAMEIRRLKDAGYLHDIGKIVFGRSLLNKNHNLNAEEYDEYKRHPVVGYRILSTYDDTVDLAEAVLAHHEYWNGSGFPKGLKSDEIPLLSRILAVVEGFDRMTNDSDNLRAMNREDALRYIRENAGILYDPEIVMTFLRMMQ